MSLGCMKGCFALRDPNGRRAVASVQAWPSEQAFEGG